MTAPTRRSAAAGSADHARAAGHLLLHPLSVTALIVLAVNDHVLKDLWGNAVTGKLSDVAGVYLFPLLGLSVIHLLADRHGPGIAGHRATIAAAVGITAVGFAAVKVIDPVGDAYEGAIGWIRWAATLGLVESRPIVVVRDVTDVLVLPVLAAAWLVASGGSDGWSRHRP